MNKSSAIKLESGPDRMQFLQPIIENIPKELKQCVQWVVWRAEFINGKWTKVPYNPQNGYKAASNKPNTWGNFDTALFRYKNSNGTFDGVGFMLSNDDPFTGWDLDHCRDPETGTIEPWAEEIIKRLNSYTEISPSGEGIRIFIIATLPEGKRRKGNIELYQDGRYLTVTGHILNGTK